MPAGTKEIRSRLTSVRNTKKITYAMKLVSAAKLRKAQEAVTKSRAYTNALNGLLQEIAREGMGADFAHPLMQSKSAVKTVTLLVIGGSRGLCGGYNTNVHRAIETFIKEKAANNISVNIVAVGKKPAEYLRRLNKSLLNSFEGLSEDAVVWPIDSISQPLEEAFVDGSTDEVHLLFTRFKSALSQTITCERILPMTGDVVSAETTSAAGGTTIFEPSAKEVFSALIPRILRNKIRQACLDAKASEQGARMTAMDAATKNAGELISKYTLMYNKLRQSGITGELLDIIGGAEAIK